METGAPYRSPELRDRIRLSIRILAVDEAKAVDSESTQIGERSVHLSWTRRSPRISVDVSACGGDSRRHGVSSRMDVDAGRVDCAQDRLCSGDFRRGAVSH